MKEEILVVDDEKEIADLIELYLSNEGYVVHKFYNGEDALECIDNCQLNLAILDIMLPDKDGFYICRKIRENHFYPVIMLTAKIDDTSKIMGLTIGADDYITKPFNPLELVARVKTQLRRYTRYNLKGIDNELDHGNVAEELEIRGLVINNAAHKCWLYDQEIDLTPREFSILWYLCQHQGTVVSTKQLYEAIWDSEYLYGSDNSIMVHIGRIREKLNEPKRTPKFIKTVWGVGYTIEK